MTLRIEVKADGLLPGSVLACQKWHQVTETKGDLHIFGPGCGQTFWLTDHEFLMVAEVKPKDRAAVGLPPIPAEPVPDNILG